MSVRTKNRIIGWCLIGIPILIVTILLMIEFGSVPVLQFIAGFGAIVIGITMVAVGILYISGEYDK